MDSITTGRMDLDEIWRKLGALRSSVERGELRTRGAREKEIYGIIGGLDSPELRDALLNEIVLRELDRISKA